jgi:hypothetical protein
VLVLGLSPSQWRKSQMVAKGRMEEEEKQQLAVVC